jgi:hypothetical protein
VEQVSIRCMKELLDRKKYVKDFDLYILREAIRDSKLALLAKRNIDRPIMVLHPHMTQTVLDCLGRKSLLLHVPGEEACSKNWVIKCVDLLFSWPNSPRRYLASQSLQQIAPRPAKALAPSPASAPPIYAPAPSDPAAASSPSPNPRPPVEPPEEPSPSPELIGLVPPAPAPPPKHFSPADQLVPRNSSKNDNGNEKKKVVAIAATAAGVVVVVALLLFCCLKGSNKKIGPKDGKRDEKPLLELSMNDFSTGIYLSSLFH